MKTYCKKNNSHCIPKAPKHDPFHRSFPPLYLGSGQRLVPMYAGCAALQLRRLRSSLMIAYSVSFRFFIMAPAIFSSHSFLLITSLRTLCHTAYRSHLGLSDSSLSQSNSSRRPDKTKHAASITIRIISMSRLSHEISFLFVSSGQPSFE